MNTDNPMHHLGDAAILAILLVGVFIGVPLWVVFAAYLGLGVVLNLLKAFNALLRPIVDLLKGRAI